VTAQLTVKRIECGKVIRLDGYCRLYCDDRCRQVLKLVHYGRRAFRDGRIEDPLVMEAIQMRIAHILGGGYHQTARRLSPATRQAVLSRDGGLCQICGQPATDIDHIAGDSSDLDNLRALCRACNMGEAQAGFRPATEEMSREVDQLMERIEADVPIHARDNEQGWDLQYRQMRADQRALMRDAGITVRG